MRMTALALSILLLAASARALPPNVEKIDSFRGIDQYRLKSNDMTILVMPDHSSPVFTFMVVYHVGSRNEGPGNTGSAHLLEHMIFNKSTENFGRANGHKTFQEVLYEAGCDYSSTNMTTWNDRMNGYSTLPSDKLELAMKIEADRLALKVVCGPAGVPRFQDRSRSASRPARGNECLGRSRSCRGQPTLGSFRMWVAPSATRAFATPNIKQTQCAREISYRAWSGC